MNIEEFVHAANHLDDRLGAFAKRPWTEKTEVLLVRSNEEGEYPGGSIPEGHQYFFDVASLQEAFDPEYVFVSGDDKVRAVIYYAEYDAYPEWLKLAE